MAEFLSRSGKPDGNDPYETPTPMLCALHSALHKACSDSAMTETRHVGVPHFYAA
jgi:hypothetical protein